MNPDVRDPTTAAGTTPFATRRRRQRACWWLLVLFAAPAAPLLSAAPERLIDAGGRPAADLAARAVRRDSQEPASSRVKGGCRPRLIWRRPPASTAVGPSSSHACSR